MSEPTSPRDELVTITDPRAPIYLRPGARVDELPVNTLRRALIKARMKSIRERLVIRRLLNDLDDLNETEGGRP